jgi:integrase
MKTTLTRLDLRRLQPGQHLTAGGIRYDRLADGDGRFTVELMVNRARIHRVIGLESEGVTLTQAQEFVEQARADARRDRLNLPKGRKVAMTFARAADEYLVRLGVARGRNLARKRQHFRDYLTPFFGHRPLSGITAFDVQRYIKTQRGRIGDASVNRTLATLSHLLRCAIEWGWLEKPVRIQRLREPPGRTIYLTPEQIGRLLDAARADACWEIYPFVLIGLHTAMRRMEILSIRWEHIDLARRVIHIPHAKAGPRDQPITDGLAAYLAELRVMASGAVWLFPAASASGHRVEIERPFRRVVEAAGMNSREVTRHTLRHTAITHLVQTGVDLPTVQRISGHKTLTMVARYSHQSGAHIAAAMDRLEERVTQELRGRKKALADDAPRL